MTTYTEQRDLLVKEARAIAKTAQDAGRDLTIAEAEQMNAKGAAISELNDKIKSAKESSDLLATLGGLRKAAEPGEPVYRDTRPSAVKAMGKAGASKIAAKLGMKASDLGDLNGQVEILFSGQPVLEDRRTVPSLTQLITHTVTDKPKYSYVRVSPLDNHAAVVKAGQLKPTSTITAEDVEGELSVIAHISSPVDEYWASDHPEVLAAYNNALVKGLIETEEAMFLHGDGTAGTPTGILNTSGIQSQSFAGDLLTTTRKAVTALEKADMVPSLFVVNPADWETIELSRDGSGRLEFEEGPVNRSEHRLWGVPVAVSPALEAGTAVLLDLDAAHVISESAIRVHATSAVGDDFARNQFRIRAEQRIAVAVVQPLGIVKVGLAA